MLLRGKIKKVLSRAHVRSLNERAKNAHDQVNRRQDVLHLLGTGMLHQGLKVKKPNSFLNFKSVVC